ncbi:hypothetical protein A4A49_10757 [Nicotiana attenuata]|uniref:Uncharacterized protein n=1 Tax=Nicotiana attenuata TaxID=49451 RepID=A0A1J6HW22_NICAT|nr:hypothetical protein A4A49_10757 [Nicotiana attenuata]
MKGLIRNPQSTRFIEDSGQLEDLDEINSTKVVGSDAIEVENDQLGTTKTTGEKVRDNSPPGDRLATPGLKPGSPGIRLAMPGLKPGTPGVRLAMPGLASGSPDEATIVNSVPITTGKILAYVDGVPVYALENKLDDNGKIRDDTVGSDQSIGNGKGGDINRTDIYEQTTTVIPGLGSVYEQQFKMMQTAASYMVNSNEKADEQAIVPRASGEIDKVPMEYGTDQIMQLHLNVRLKTPLQHLHDLVTHNVAPIAEDLMRQTHMEYEGDDESTAENFKQVARMGIYHLQPVLKEEKVESVMWNFWRLLNNFSVVLVCLYAQYKDGLAMFRMISTLEVREEKDLSLQEHKITQLHRPGGARLKPDDTLALPCSRQLKASPGMAFALQSLLKASPSLAFALQSLPKASPSLAFALQSLPKANFKTGVAGLFYMIILMIDQMI